MKCVVLRSKCGGPQFILLFTGTAVKNVHAAAAVRMASSLSEIKKKKEKEGDYSKDLLALTHTQKTGIQEVGNQKKKMWARRHRSKNDNFSYLQNEINDV